MSDGSGAGLTDPTTGADAVDPCAMSNSDDRFGLRIGGIFVILVTSTIGTLAPIVLRQSSFIPKPVFEFAKFFGSGVIIATAFIHLLAPAFEELGSECLSGTWTEYDWAPALAMAAVYGIFFAEVAAYRIGSRKLARLGIEYNTHAGEPSDAHAHDHGREVPLDVPTQGDEAQGHVHPHAAGRMGHSESPILSTSGSHTRDVEKSFRGMEGDASALGGAERDDDDDSLSHEPSKAEASAQLIGVAVLEFGVILHSVIIGLTLAVNEDFITLFVVIIFHQMFEGLGLGSRLSALYLPRSLRWTRYAAAMLYSICTPIGMAVGLGVRETYNGNGATANIASGVLDSLSAGILLYTGLVELMAHEIVLNPRMMKSSSGRLTYVFGCMLLGSGLMALLGRWA